MLSTGAQQSSYASSRRSARAASWRPRNTKRRAPARVRRFPGNPYPSNKFSGTLLQKTPVTGFPDSIVTRLRYNVFRSFSVSGTTGQDVYQFKCNSMFDPDLTSTGHQPLYRDQLYTVYKYAVVTGCRWNLKVSTTSITGQLINVQATTYSTVDTDTSAAVERGQVAQAFVQLGAPRELTGYVSMPVLFGTTLAALITDDLYRHDTNADPTQLAYLSVYAQDCELASARLSYCMTLDFSVMFKEVVKVAQS